MKRLWALLVALCAAGILLASPFLLAGGRDGPRPDDARPARIPLTGAVVAHVLLGNGVSGAAFGWMFRRRGPKGAMVAHAAADVWLQGALPVLLA